MNDHHPTIPFRVHLNPEIREKDQQEGQKADDDKPRWDLLPGLALHEIVLVLTYGARKYAPDNWRHVPDAKRRYAAAGLRHFWAWFWKGEKSDPESGFHHLAHACCCFMFLMELGL